MKRLFFVAVCILAIMFYCSSCCRNAKNNIFQYCDLQDSLECFISQAPEFPENTPSFFCVIFYADSLKERVDTIVNLVKGNAPFSSVNEQKVIGATCFYNHICEVVYDGFEHLPSIVNEDMLTLSTDDYKRYGFNKEIYDDPQYKEWLDAARLTSQRKSLNRIYRIKRPHLLERIF